MTASAFGPLPALSSCTCRICHPDPPRRVSADDRDCIDTVRRFGWQVTVVGAAGTCSCCGEPSDAGNDGPVFAYTVGLGHRAGHSELAMSGLPAELMHRVLNIVADRVVNHALRLHPGDVLETALPNAPITVDEVSRDGLRHIGAMSTWFQRAPVSALQLVWPTPSGVFVWQPGAPPELDELQPPEWRVPSRRTGALAVDPPWPLPAEPDTLVVVCTHIRARNEPVRFVARTQDDVGAELWDVHCGRDHGDGIDQLQLEHIAHTVRAAPSIRQIADLEVGEFAERSDAFSPWHRGMLQDV